MDGAPTPPRVFFSKQALIISTAAGAGTSSTMRDLTDSLRFWGVGRIHTFGKNTWATNWQGVSDKNKQKWQRQVAALCRRIHLQSRRVTPAPRIKALFYGSRLLHKHLRLNPVDVEYWQAHGWLDDKRPW